MRSTATGVRQWAAAAVGMLVLATATGSAQASPNGAGPRAGMATGAFTVAEFTITPYQLLDNGAALNRFHAIDVFHGGIEGTGSVEAQMLTRTDGSSNAVGLIHVTGCVHDRCGSFVIQTVSSSDASSARSSWSVLEGTGTDELAGLTGWGSETAVNDGGSWSARYQLHYYFR